VDVSTPYGEPSDPLVVGDIGGRSVAFLPRHGRDHRYPPHRINYRANLWALRSVGVRQVLGPCAVGSLRGDLGAGTVVVPDQLVDRTTSRVQTYFDVGAVHVPFADPYCPVGRSTVVSTATAAGLPVVDGGVMAVIEGPRFSTRAESHWYAAQGWSLVNMTGHPEAVLARELALCYTAVALVTDVDAGVDAESAVAQEEVFRVFAENVEKLRELLFAAVAALPTERSCPCTRAHDGIELPITLPA
jgi:5'-methylthioadenosine phosphorylase